MRRTPSPDIRRPPFLPPAVPTSPEGQDEQALQPVRQLPLQQLVGMGKGRFPQAAVDGGQVRTTVDRALALLDGRQPAETSGPRLTGAVGTA